MWQLPAFFIVTRLRVDNSWYRRFNKKRCVATKIPVCQFAWSIGNLNKWSKEMQFFNGIQMNDSKQPNERTVNDFYWQLSRKKKRKMSQALTWLRDRWKKNLFNVFSRPKVRRENEGEKKRQHKGDKFTDFMWINKWSHKCPPIKLIGLQCAVHHMGLVVVIKPFSQMCGPRERRKWEKIANSIAIGNNFFCTSASTSNVMTSNATEKIVTFSIH